VLQPRSRRRSEDCFSDGAPRGHLFPHRPSIPTGVGRTSSHSSRAREWPATSCSAGGSSIPTRGFGSVSINWVVPGEELPQLVPGEELPQLVPGEELPQFTREKAQELRAGRRFRFDGRKRRSRWQSVGRSRKSSISRRGPCPACLLRDRG
jgi:hypothetical protein